MSAWRRSRSGLTLGRSFAAGHRSAIERLENRVLLSTWTVNTLNDLVANDGVLSLREAISMSASDDTINFAPSLAGGTITLDGTQLQIQNKNLNIVGLGADQLTISGNTDSAKYSRVFHISGSVVSIEGLTMAGGHATYDAEYGYSAGGAIYSDSSTVTIRGSVLSGNQAAHNVNTHTLQAAYGGAIYNASGTLTIIDSLLSGNSTSTDLSFSTTGRGGAIYNASGTLTINNSTLSGNLASSGNPDRCLGGAIYNSGVLMINSSTFSGNDSYTSGGAIESVSPGTLTISNSTFSANTTSYEGGAIRANSSALTLTDSTFSGNRVSDGHGGAIYANNGAILTVTNSTFNDNRAFGNGGVIYAASASALTLTNCTLSGNRVTATGSSNGGAIYNSSSTIVARNSIISGNTRQGVADDVYGTLDSSSSHNLIGVGGGLTNGVNGNIVGVSDPKLGSLASNGGPTQTMALLADSLALDAGDNSLIPTGVLYDQRGTGHARIVHGTVDIGAYESGLPDDIAPMVTAVYVRGSTWASGYLSFLAANLAGSSASYGYAIPVGSGAAQLQTLPWRNLNRISIAFSEDVTVAQAQVAIAGSVGRYSVSGFSYSAADHVASWSLAAAIGPDKLYVALPGSGSTPVRDAAGNVLDGEWSNPSSYSDSGSSDTFPSGNGSAGGDFAFRFDVLPGDSTGGSLGKVNVADALQSKGRSGLPVSLSTYRSDFDGNNLVNVADVLYVKSKSSVHSLPVNPPTLPVFGPVFSQVSLLQRDRSLVLW